MTGPAWAVWLARRLGVGPVWTWGLPFGPARAVYYPWAARTVSRDGNGILIGRPWAVKLAGRLGVRAANRRGHFIVVDEPHGFIKGVIRP